jgi:hypothetical protein
MMKLNPNSSSFKNLKLVTLKSYNPIVTKIATHVST